VGIRTPSGKRNDLSQAFANPHFYHFATEIEGNRLITDSGPAKTGGGIYLASFGEPGEEALKDWQWLVNPRSSWDKGTHVHPFLSPDGKLGFFNSDESGRLQAYMIRGL
jgi:hypothetical protein